MVDAVQSDFAAPEAHPPARWVSWLATLSLVLALAPALIWLLGARGVLQIAPLEAVIAYGAGAVIALGTVIGLGLARRRVPTWALASVAIVHLILAAELGHALADIAAGLDVGLLLALAALAPSAAAVWARSRLDLTRAPTIRRAVAAASAVAFAELGALCVLAADVLPAGGPFSPGAVIVLFAIIGALPMMTAALAARREKKLPIAFNPDPPYGHITSLGALTLVLFVLIIAGLGLWSSSNGIDARISQNTGLGTVAGLVVAFFAVAIMPTSRRVSKALDAISKTLERWLGGVSKGFSAFDATLVFAVAPLLGATQPKRIPRYGLLFGHLIGLGVLGWLLPAPWGLIPLISAFVGVVAIARRWAWVEEDRENAMLNRQFSGDHIRIGFSNDLRDEALLGFMSLFVIVPLALRQLHIADGGHMFVINETTNADDVWAWIGFFGAELAKAVPFVDWAEIYQVEGAAPISMDESHVGEAQHAVFATRVVVDLVFLAALLQAISSLQRSAKLKSMFYDDRTIDRLDPFAEDAAFRELAVATEDGGWKLIDKVPQPFWDYDEDRLEHLAQPEEGAIPFVARAILERNRQRLPEELLADEARQETPDPAKLEALVGRIRDERVDPDIGQLKLAHLILNSDSKAWSVRAQIVQIIADNWRKDGAVAALCDMIIPSGARDGRAEVRLIALTALNQAALLENDRSAQQTIVWAAVKGNDGSTKVLNAAAEMLKQNPNWQG
ncbi:MAG: hypothetical protein AB7G40_05280 [Hyphomonadaceae bacterium]